MRGVRRWVVASAAAASVAVAGIGVMAATPAATATPGNGAVPPQSPPATFLDTVAADLGIPASTLQAAIEKADVTFIQQAESRGRLRPAEAQAAIARVQAGRFFWAGPRGMGPGGGPGALRRGAPRAFWQAGAAAAREYLGLSTAQLRAQLKAGKSLDAIAAATPGKSAAGLQAAIQSAIQARLQQAESQGKLTAAQVQKVEQNLAGRIQALTARTWHAPAARGRMGLWWGRGGRWARRHGPWRPSAARTAGPQGGGPGQPAGSSPASAGTGTATPSGGSA